MKTIKYYFGIYEFLVFGISSMECQVFPTTAIQNNGDVNKRINFVYLAEGYTSGELPSFITDVVGINTDVFTQSPFSNYANFFYAYAVQVNSSQSGADHPGSATDVTEPGAHPLLATNTYFDATFDYFNIHRLLVATNFTAIANILAANLPQFDQGFILINSPFYGGSGGQFATSSTHASASEIAIHEVGHSFANLSDEYYAGDFYARENYNMTQETNPTSVKWKDWYGENGIGIYQHCCGGASASWYRPHQDCKMRFLGVPFCSVCTERIIDKIYTLVTPIDAFTPVNLTQTNTGAPLNFDLNLVYPNPNTLTIEWILNGTQKAMNTESLELNTSDLMLGSNSLVAKITDKTTLSRSFLPNSGYEFTVTWTINNSIACTSILDVTDNPIPAGIYHASLEVSSASQVDNGAAVEFRAGDRVILLPGFNVPDGVGSTFTITIQGCP
jgi:hypothetical protein